jgi:hypothetical protein
VILPDQVGRRGEVRNSNGWTAVLTHAGLMANLAPQVHEG